MSEPALCQCRKCYRYLVHDRPIGGAWFDHHCTECGGDAKLAEVRGTLTDKRMLEVLSLIAEECAEIAEAADLSRQAGRVVQRVCKIIRFGWQADFQGTTQQHKLEVELGDLLAALQVAAANDVVDMSRITGHMNAKMGKLREDADGPRQRLMHARVPGAGE